MEFPKELKNPIQSGNFTFYDTSIEGVKVVDVKLYGDARGGFMETYREENFVAGGIGASFVQDNQSYSVQGVLRGLHFQIEHPQAKLVRVISGTVFDVAVDLREGSPTWGQWEGVIHGFLVLSETAEFCYKCDDIYHPGDEGGIMWNDPELGVEWPAFLGEKNLDPVKVILSDKDKIHPALSTLKK